MNRAVKLLLPLAAVAVLAPGAFAQPPGGAGGFNPSPADRAKMEAMRKWNENNKNVRQVQRTLFRVARLEEDPKNALNKDQARKILAVIKAWRHKPVMKDEEARKVITQ